MTEHLMLTVQLHGQPIGTITHLGGERTLFALHENYIANSNRPTLGLRFKDAFGELITDFRPYKIRLMPFFSNLLPEGPLRLHLAQKANVHVDREFFLLQALGQDLPGAITVRGEGRDTTSPTASTEPQTANPATPPAALHFSLAGVQLKFSAIKNTRRGLTIPANGTGGDWIVKLPARDFAHVPENEFSMMTLARMTGMDVPEIALMDVNSIANLPENFSQNFNRTGQQAFVIKRFDRNPDGSANHIEDFAQVFDVYPEDKYKTASMRDVATVIAAEAGQDDIAELIRRLTFNVLIGNGDMHLKNWSLIYPDQRHAKLAPAYDFVSTIAYIENDKSALKLSRSKDFVDFTLDELSHLCAKAALPSKLVKDAATETVAAFMAHWTAEKSHLPLTPNVTHAIDQHLQKLPIVRDTTS